MNIKLEELQAADAEDLYQFERDNRDYFETMVPSRGEDYYNVETFKTRLESLLDEQSKGQSYYYLIKNEDGLILGRMNLVDIDRSDHSAHIGYRVGKSYTGKGIAYRALELLLETLNKREVNQILAKTTTTNIGSKKVLEKNGFKHIETSDETFLMNGKKMTFVYYKWTVACG
ncbi:GNAT family N-acetyltransferase [Alteribacter aurantiacus]|uniref:GNAT family N-acetyltransferase n=1 Tax=Alteribacter aurantiacus TaxID=254410 RepID=UPI000428FBFF|nr:GNAT family N-acetyltransferase [Alteribacter aurantiacus]